MRVSTLAWALLLLVSGATIAGGWLPGSSGWATGPRIGIAALLLMVGTLLVMVPWVQWVLRKTTKASDYSDGCPVGARCACGHFNLKPRVTCKSCGLGTAWAGASQTGRESQAIDAPQ